MVVVGLHLVKVLTGLLLETVLAIENELEGVEGTNGLASPCVPSSFHEARDTARPPVAVLPVRSWGTPAEVEMDERAMIFEARAPSTPVRT